MRYVLAVFLTAMLAIASPASVVPAMAQSGRVCLEVVRGNTFSSWQNNCPFKVYVNWSDGESCRNYGCASSIAANTKSTATISRKTDVEWCEFHNGKSGSCLTGAYGTKAGPPTASGAASGNASTGGGAVQFGGGGSSGPTPVPMITAEQRKAYGRCAGDAQTEATFDAIYAEIGGMTGGRDIAGFQQAVQFIVYGIGARDPAKWKRFEALVNRCL